MKFYGYAETDTKTLITLADVTIQAKPDELRNIANFLIKCASDIENNENWEHEHLIDYLNINGNLVNVNADIVVCKTNT